MGAFALTAAKQRVFTPEPVKRNRQIGSGLTVLCKIRYTCDRGGICGLIIDNPIFVCVQTVDIILRRDIEKLGYSRMDDEIIKSWSFECVKMNKKL